MESWAHRFFELSTQLLAMVDAEGRLLQVSPAWQREVGWTSEQLKAAECWHFIHPDDLELMKTWLRASSGATDTPSEFLCRWRCADGAWKVLCWNVLSSEAQGPLYCSLRSLEGTSIPGSVSPANLGWLGETLEAFQRTERSFRKLIESLPDGIFVFRQERRITYINPTMCRALGYRPAELFDRPILDIIHPDSLPQVKRRISNVTGGGTNQLEEVRFLRKDGSAFDTESTSLPIEFDGRSAVAVVSRDITERKRLQAQLLQTDRMVMVGTLAAGVGHEINNPLSYILTNIRLSLENLQRVQQPLGEQERIDTLLETREMLQEAHTGGLRVRDIVRDLKLFSRQAEERKTELDVCKPLEFSLKMAMGELRHRARIVKRYEPAPNVFAEESRLGQVFLNLLMNAAQALPEGESSQNEVSVWVRPSPSGGVCVDVSDTGTGIPPHVLGRIFEPFFTTKPVGMGTGLGLSICHDIVRELGGELSVRSQVGQGTTFTLQLPAASRAQAAAIPSRTSHLAVPTVRRGRMLVIDNEPAVARSLARLIGPMHVVMLVRTGQEGITRLTSQEPFDVIFCDLTMPDVSGMDVYTQVCQIRPELAPRFIFMTGGSFTPRARQFLESMNDRWLEKPFDEKRLQRLIRDMMRLS